ncbi:MAG: 2-succinyl-5-enolpyruvyl-6-hydroxy-3-cyclohexene-1-carboxylic-acid synthase [Acidimicrobiia bacterium]|nr:2-succinyl-5-enolpyruvyl-6-hydroxy-3-cyclohexene-1-carboxylic-acid synthase [Acidimicrobiia bacterium]
MATTYEIIVAFVDELAAHGLRHVCISPGSRSTPLALTVARHPDISHWVHHDERSAAFFALGIAKTTRLPAAVVTTSGTAAAELHPAAVEARYGRVPLLLLTADRPPSLRGTGANQTIDQVNLFGSSVKLFEDAPLAAVSTPAATRTLAARAWAEAVTAPAGPVHLNFPFDEPLMPEGPFPEFGARVERITWTAPSNAPEEQSLRTLAETAAGRRGILLAGPRGDSPSLEALLDLAAATGFPILADPLSGLRVGRHDLSRVVGHYDALAQAGFLDEMQPELAIRFGVVPTSKAINNWLADHPDVAHATVDTTGWRDPGGTAQLMVTADPDTTARQLAKLITTPAPADWLHAWLAADRTAGQALAETPTEFTELAAVATVLSAVPEPAIVWVSSSMPIRQVDLMLGATDREMRLLANRGASGIDGFISSGIGSAVAGDQPTVLITGDLSLLHDLTALGWASRHRTDITIVLINNDGGGIFHLLPPVSLPEFEELFGTPHGLDFSQAARLFGIEYVRVGTGDELQSVLATTPNGPRLIEATFEREAGVAAYRAAIDRVRLALGG